MNLLFDKRHSATSMLTAAVSAYRFVGFDGAHATQAGGQHDPQGISEQAGIGGQAISLATGYSHPVEAAGAIAVGDYVGPSTDGTGRAVNVTVAGGQQFGRALTAAASAGELVVVAFAGRAAGMTASQAAAGQGLVSGAGIPGAAHPRYFAHLFAGNQLPDDAMVYDISGAGSHAQREADLTVSAMWTTAAGYASTLDTAAVDGQRLRRLKLPALNWDWMGGESLMIWWLGKCTAEASSTNLMGTARGVAGENGFRVRVASTGALGMTMSEGATATTTFTTSTLLPFDGALHSIGFWLDGRGRLGYSYVDETVQVDGNSPTGDMLPTAAQVAAGTDRLILGGDSLLTGSATSSIAQSTRALAVLKFAATDTVPTAEQVRQAMLQLRAAPHRPILRGAL